MVSSDLAAPDQQISREKAWDPVRDQSLPAPGYLTGKLITARLGPAEGGHVRCYERDSPKQNVSHGRHNWTSGKPQ